MYHELELSDSQLVENVIEWVGQHSATLHRVLPYIMAFYAQININDYPLIMFYLVKDYNKGCS